jgi:hypothetical protein
MNSQELYLNICQIISEGERTPMTWPTDFNRNIAVHVSRSSQGRNISHITVEFTGIRAKFLSCLMFDGSSDYGTGVHTFAMPRIKTTIQQKALGCLSVLEYLIDNDHLQADMAFFREKVIADLTGGVGDTLIKYDKMCAASRRYLAETAQGKNSDIAA